MLAPHGDQERGRPNANATQAICFSIAWIDTNPADGFFDQIPSPSAREFASPSLEALSDDSLRLGRGDSRLRRCDIRPPIDANGRAARIVRRLRRAANERFLISRSAPADRSARPPGAL